MNSKRAAVLSLSIVLILGILIGIVLDRYLLMDIFRPPFVGRHHADFVGHVTKELQLNEQQQAQLKVLLEEVKKSHEELREKIGPSSKKVREEFHDKFKKILTEEQQTKFAKMIENEKLK
jgi:hypothetical protein